MDASSPSIGKLDNFTFGKRDASSGSCGNNSRLASFQRLQEHSAPTTMTHTRYGQVRRANRCYSSLDACVGFACSLELCFSL